MTCNGCRSHVEEALSKVKGVSKATVDLKKAEATIEMEKHIPLERMTVENIAFTNRENTTTFPKLKKKHQKEMEQVHFIVRCIAKEIKHIPKRAIALSAEWI